MKKFAIALFAAVLIAGQFFTPVAAAAPTAWQASESCGDTVTVHRGDYLAEIARRCDTTVADILARNPQISNPNYIVAGMVLRLTGNAPQPRKVFIPNTGQRPFFGNNFFFSRFQGFHFNQPFRSAQVILSKTRAEAGDEITVHVRGFPANANIDFRVGKQGESYTTAYDGKTGSNGEANMAITIPSEADKGEHWVVRVMTTELVVGPDVTSPAILITN